MTKQIIAIMTAILGVMLGVVPVFAHVVVKPNQVGAAAFQTFTIGVPNEKNSPVVGLRLVVPNGLKNISPNVKPGWSIEVKKEKVYEGMKGEKLNNGKEAPYTEKVTEIVWTGGSIPAEQRDDFFFSAQVPADETTIQWKAYQTYQNGDVVSWDQAPVKDMSDDQREEMEKKGLGPYSETKVVNDLKDSHMMGASDDAKQNDKVNALTYVSHLALVLSIVALVFSLRKKK
jgi:uncharacterized protein YcnI